MEQTKIQKKKAAEKYARERRAFLASLDEPIITVHSPQLERAMGRAVEAATVAKARSVSHDKPDWVLHPVETDSFGWVLGRVAPNQSGYTPTSLRSKNLSFKDALVECMDEAANRGISNEAYNATIQSSMHNRSFHQALSYILEDQAQQQRALEAELTNAKLED